MINYRNKLLGEIELWRDKGIINEEQAKQIAALYLYNADANWGKVVFASIGAIVFGLGVILIFAYNWEAMHRLAKLGLVLASVAIAHGIGFYYSRTTSQHPRIGESLHLLGTMLFGAGIWLIAQVYHIDEHYPDAFLVWAIGAVMMAWLLPSLSHTLLALVLILFWHSTEIFEFRAINHGASWLILIGVLPVVLYLRSSSGLFLSCALLFFSYSTSYAKMNDDGGLLSVMLSLSGALILASYIGAKTHFPQSQNIIRFIGVSIFSVLLFLLTFEDLDSTHFRSDLSELGALHWTYFFIPPLFFTGMLLYLFTRSKYIPRDTIERSELTLIATTVFLGVLNSFPLFRTYDITWVIFSIIFLSYSLLLVYRGTRYLIWQSTALGGLLLSAYIFARFLDLFESLLLRGLAFIVVGAMLFAIGFYYSHQKQIAAQKETAHAG